MARGKSNNSTERPVETNPPAPVGFGQALSERYLSYALSTIMARSLPDVRDGLKPVQRRLLYAMRLLKLDPNAGYKKCARVVGDVIGKYHPHGDTAVYDALVRLAQDFTQRYPLIDGQGNFGNVDGDNPAAMRYTESRMTLVSDYLLQGLNEDAVDFRATYDGEESEPIVLPANFPHLLANGAQGIAVGMATSIPPHHVGELIDGCMRIINEPDCTIADLVEHIHGPDFPTGGTLVESKELITAAYETGRGSMRVRAKYEVEQFKGGAWQIVVTEVPYQIVKGKLIEKVANLILSKKLPLLADIRDESSEDIRIVLEPRSRNVDPELLMASMFKFTDFETRISMNMNVLDGNNIPRVMNLKEVLRAFLDHRQDVLQRRTRNRLSQIEKRLEILAGLMVAFLNVDEVIRIVRFEDHPKQALIDTFDITEVQAEAILNLRLRALNKLEEIEIKREQAELQAEKDDLDALMGDEGLQWRRISLELEDVKATFGDGRENARRTIVAEAAEIEDFDEDAFVEKEPITVILSKRGWIRAAKGHNVDPAAIKYKDGDEGRFVLTAQTTDKILLVTASGRVYTLGADKLPGGRGFGEPLTLIIDIEATDPIVTAFVHQAGNRLLLGSSDGKGFIAEEKDLIAGTKTGKQAMNPTAPAKLSVCRSVSGDSVAVVGDNRKLLIFPLDELPVMARGKGVKLQAYKDGGMKDAKTFKLEDGLTWPWGKDKTRTEKDLLAWQGKRGSAGRMVPNGFPKDGKF